MYSSLKPGLAIKAQPTQLNQNCGIDTAVAQGYICKADDEGISVYVQWGSNHSWVKALMTPETFANNFEEDMRKADNIGYNIYTHFSKRYPEDYLR